MTDIPKLTIGIPHLNRTEHLQWAIDSCLKQREPVVILVGDQGHTRETKYLIEQYRNHPHIRHVQTEATCLWENWRATAEACDTAYFAWLQDDDTLSRAFSKSVYRAFEAFPLALHWQASCYTSPDRIHATRWGWNGPQVGLNMQDLIPEIWPGEYLVASMYILCWALAPGWAFRCGPEFSEALERIPSDCDLFTERLIPAEMGSRGPAIMDPLTAGYWHHHGKNESYNQNRNGSMLAQTKTFVRCLDAITDRTEQWEAGFYHWLRNRSGLDYISWLDTAKKDENHPLNLSKHSAKLKELLKQVLAEGGLRAEEKALAEGRVLAPEPVDPVGELIWSG